VLGARIIVDAYVHDSVRLEHRRYRRARVLEALGGVVAPMCAQRGRWRDVISVSLRLGLQWV
jgi:hypothetical protein